MRHYLTVSYDEKDKAKKIARDNGTSIRWDSVKKKWYWEGSGNLPSCLERFTYQTTRAAYAKRNRSFAEFMASPASDNFKKQQRKILIDDAGMTEEEYAKMEADQEEEMDKGSESELWVCNAPGCLWTWDYNGEAKCPDCGSKKIEKI